MKNWMLPTRSLRVVAVAVCLIALTAVSSADGAEIRGTVQLGPTGNARPQVLVTVKLFEATPGAPIELARDRTNFAGQFRIDSPTDTTNSIFFLTASLGYGVELVTILGPNLPTKATVNELTTVAACYSMAQFFRTGVISGSSFQLQLAAGMNDNIVDFESGDPSEVLKSPPNADQTHSLRMTRSLANLMRLCADNFVVRLLFFELTRPDGSFWPDNTAVAFANLARDPGKNALLLYLLSQTRDSYFPALFRAPDAWTVTVKVNDSGDDSAMFGGPGNIAFDSRGYGWIANNVVQETPTSTNNIIVLKPNGKPADGGPGFPVSPVTGGGILGSGWGIAVDPFDHVWVGNFGWGGLNPTMMPPGSGSVSRLTNGGLPVSVPDGYYGGTFRVQALKSDANGNMWMASFGNDSVVYFPNGNPLQAEQFNLYAGSGPFGVAIDANNHAWVTMSGGLAGQNQSSVAKFRIDNLGKIELLFLRTVGDTLKVIDVDSQGNAWFASQGNSTIYVFRPDGNRIGRFSRRGGLDGPWGLTIDGEDNIWVSNFGALELGNFTTGGITKLAGASAATRPPGTQMGEALSPRTGYTVHSAGAQVRLHDGTPLNGIGSLPVFVPLMRQTSLQIDQAGNIWTMNNWKPRFSTDTFLFDTGQLVDDPGDDANPGGDGVVIFVGLAPPPKPASAW